MANWKQNGTDSIQNLADKHDDGTNTIKSYKRRFWILALFSTLSMLSGMIFSEFASMANIVMCFYGVSAETVNWTCLIYMVVYIVLIFPVSWLMGKLGLRKAILIGSVCNTAAMAVQFASLRPDSFSLVMVSSFMGSLSNVFVLSVPPCLAAEWFPSNEVSRACAMGVFGNQLGVALGFAIPPLLIPTDCSNISLIADGKRNLTIIFTSFNAIVMVLIILTFQNKPDHPPSLAQADKKEVKESYLKSILSMVRNVHFILVFVVYGLVVGTYFSLATNLNNMMIRYFPDAEVAIGWMGLLVIVTGLVGSIILGYILDYTRKFKETSISVCFLSFILYVMFSCLLPLKTMWIQFISIGFLGFFLTSFLPVGFEYGIEVTYPESEIISSCLLNMATMIFGIILTVITSTVLMHQGPTYANIALGAALFIGSIISCFITKDYKRSKKENCTVWNTKL